MPSMPRFKVSVAGSLACCAALEIAFCTQGSPQRRRRRRRKKSSDQQHNRPHFDSPDFVRADSSLGLPMFVDPVMSIMSLFLDHHLSLAKQVEGANILTCARWHSRLLTPHVLQQETLAAIGASNLPAGFPGHPP